MASLALPANGKYWLKRARLELSRTDGCDPALCAAAACDGTLLADVRIEDGRIRAVLPAGGAPCCCPGIDLGGGTVRPLPGTARVAPGAPADLLVDWPALGPLVLRAGAPGGPCDIPWPPNGCE